jgi:rRNA small subunit pseudouridine methyltransferase Nep1
LLTLVLVESALEPIPEQLWKHPAIQKYAKQRHKHPRFIVLDRSYHHSAMKTLALNEKRGRPDIVHIALLEALGSPLNKEKLLQIHVHTLNDCVIWVNPETRLPRNCNRFVSLMEQLFEFGQIPPEGNEAVLLSLKKQTLTQLINKIKPSHILALSRIGRPEALEATVSKFSREKRPVMLVGGFPHGNFSESTTRLADEIVCIDKEMLETWTIVSRVIYEFERALSLPRKRLALKE